MGRSSEAKKLKAIEPAPLLKLDLGCGIRTREGFDGVDRIAYDGVTHLVDLTVTPWPWADNSVSEAHCSHFLEHLTQWQRVAFANELYRILVPNGTCFIITPHWCSSRAYGDPTHQWPPVSEFWFPYLSQGWREKNAPHTDIAHNPQGFTCNFESTGGYSMRNDLLVKHDEYQQFALANYKEVAMDTLTTIKAVK